MLRRFLFTAFIALPVLFAQSALATQAASEEVKSRPNKQEITDLMIQTRLPSPTAEQQDRSDPGGTGRQ